MTALVTVPADLRLVVHPGLPKTATTFLQETVFSRHPEVASLGKPFTRTHRRLQLNHLLRDIARLPESRWPAERGRIAAALQRIVDASALVDASRHRALVISYENLYHPNRELPPNVLLPRVEELFGDRVHWLVTLRAQPAWIDSYYLYTFVDYLEQGGEDLNSWAAAERRRPTNPFTCADYAATLAPLLERVGDARLLVAPMEALLRDADGLASRRLPRFIGIDEALTGRLLAEATPIKERIWEHQLVLGRTVRLARRAGMGPVGLWLLRRLLGLVDRRMLETGGLERAHAGTPFATLFSNAERETMARGNRWIGERFGHDLAAYGYPLDAQEG